MKIQLADKSVVLIALLAICVGILLLWLVLHSVSVQAQAPEPAYESAYTDVPQDAWYREPVAALEEKGIFEGTDCEEGFCPGEPLERWQMAVWLVRILDGQDPASIDESRFADVGEHEDWIHFIDRLSDLEVTTGCKAEPLSYCPNRAVTRSQMAAFLYRAFNLPDAGSPAGFTDVSEESWAFGYINALAASGITAGCKSEPFSYCPSQSVTKAQMATFLYRALEWQEAQPEFITEENELSRLVKYEIVDRHAEENPWLLAVWNHTNRPDFEYLIEEDSNYASAIFSGNSAIQISVPQLWMESGPFLENAIVHEMALIYILVDVPSVDWRASTAIAHLYFDSLSDNALACTADALYADAAQLLVPIEGNDHALYWWFCEDVPNSVTPEAVAVVRNAFNGETPQWFHDTFQKADDSLDYEAIWTAITAVDNIFIRGIIASQLEHEFGGYCSEQAVYSALLGDSQFSQPWRDGGCPED